MYDKADWEKIREEVSTKIADDSGLSTLSSKVELEVAVDGLEAAVNEVLEEHVERARPSPYAKRWWTDELKSLRLSLSAARNRLTTIRRRGEDVAEAAARVKLVRRLHGQDRAMKVGALGRVSRQPRQYMESLHIHQSQQCESRRTRAEGGRHGGDGSEP